MNLCQHCKIRKLTRARGLCWTCSMSSGVRAQYPSTSKFARRGVGNSADRAPLPPCPTSALPGSPDKLAVLGNRAAAGLALHHPEDAGSSDSALSLDRPTMPSNRAMIRRAHPGRQVNGQNLASEESDQ